MAAAYIGGMWKEAKAKVDQLTLIWEPMRVEALRSSKKIQQRDWDRALSWGGCELSEAAIPSRRRLHGQRAGTIPLSIAASECMARDP